jgi:hypothetical protein
MGVSDAGMNGGISVYLALTASQVRQGYVAAFIALPQRIMPGPGARALDINVANYFCVACFRTVPRLDDTQVCSSGA